MEKETDGIGEPKATWTFCGAIPLEEIKNGRRACRRGWRNRGAEDDMLSVVLCDNQGEPTLGLQRETEDIIDGSTDDFSCIDDLMANDWFLEDQKLSEATSSPATLVEAPNWLEKELGELTPEQLQKVTGILRRFMITIRELMNRGKDRMDQCSVTAGVNCASCAFNPATDGSLGFAATAYGLMRTFRLTAPFMCHRSQSSAEKAENMVRTETLEHCVGFSIVFITYPGVAKDAAMRATDSILEIVPGANMKMPPE